MKPVWRLALVAVALGPAACQSNDAGVATAVDPAALYSQMCARCHGADGRGNAEVKKSLPVRDFSDPEIQHASMEALERAIMAGKNRMPGFGQALSMPKIQSLAGYVKRLSAGGGGR